MKLLPLLFLLLTAPTLQADDSPEKEKEPSKGSRIFQQAQCETLPQVTTEDLWKVSECFYKQQDITQAVSSLKELVRKNSKDLEATFVMAWMLWEEGQRLGGRAEKTRIQEAIAALLNARKANPTHWKLDIEIGDFYFLRMGLPERAYPDYIKARENFGGDYSRSVPEASRGQKAAIENRIARTALVMGRKGEAVEASCRALYFDPDDIEAEERIKKVSGSCARKGIKNPLKE